MDPGPSDLLILNFAEAMDMGGDLDILYDKKSKIYLTTGTGTYVSYDLRLLGNEIYFHPEGSPLY
jgi:hypothetical protein